MKVKTELNTNRKLFILLLTLIVLGSVFALSLHSICIAHAEEVDYTFEEVPIESITISVDGEVNEVQPGHSFTISYEVKPWYTTRSRIFFDILSCKCAVVTETSDIVVENGKAYGNAKITVMDTATVGNTFNVVAGADNIESNKIEITVAKVPVERISLSVDGNDSRLHVGKTRTLKCEFYPSNATYKNLRYEVAGTGTKYIESFDEQTGIIKAKDDITVLDVNSSVTITAYSVDDDTIYDSTTLSLYMPTTIVNIAADTPLERLTDDGKPLAVANSKKGDTVKLNTTVNGVETSGLNYIIVEGQEYIENGIIHEDGTFTIRRTAGWAKNMQIPHPEIKIRAAYSDGFDEITISVYVPVERISFIGRAPTEVENNRSYDLSAEIFPKYATLLADNANVLEYSLNGLSENIASVSEAGLLYLPKSLTSKGKTINFSAALVNSWDGVDVMPLTHELNIIPVYAESFKTIDILKNGQSVISDNVKILPSDKLQVEVEFNVDNVTDTVITLQENSNMLSTDGQTINIAQLNAMESNNPYIPVTIVYDNGGNKFNALRNLSIYVPAESAKISDSIFNRDETLNLNKLITINGHGYASNKTIEWGTPEIINGTSALKAACDDGVLNISSQANAGTVVRVPYKTYDRTSWEYKEFTVAPLADAFSLIYGKSSEYDIDVSAPQLEEGQGVDLFLSYKGLGGVRNYGLSYTVTTDRNKANLSFVTDGRDSDEFRLNILNGQSGKNNTVNYVITVHDGACAYTIKTSEDPQNGGSVVPLKNIAVFKRIRNAIGVNNTVVRLNDKFEITNWDDSVTYNKNDLSFKISGGTVIGSQITTAPSHGFILTISATQKYNGVDIAYSEEIPFNAVMYKNDEGIIKKTVYKKQNYEMTLDNAMFEKDEYAQTGWSKAKNGDKEYALNGKCAENQDVDLYAFWSKTKISVALSGKYENTWMGTDYSGWNTLDSLEKFYTHETSLDELKNVGYSSMNINVTVHHSIWGTVDYQIRIYDETTGSELAKGTHSSGNGESQNRSFSFSNIALSEIDCTHKIVVQVRCKKQHAVWGGELTVSSPNYTIEFIK